MVVTVHTSIGYWVFCVLKVGRQLGLGSRLELQLMELESQVDQVLAVIRLGGRACQILGWG